MNKFFNLKKMLLGKLHINMQRKKLDHYLTPYKKSTQNDLKSQHNTRNHKPPTGEHRQNTLRHKSQQDPL